jgi:NTP pyrophosphatase (non-canonical NTP hydrolase)
MNYTKLAYQIYQTAKEKGWWDHFRPSDEILMLVLTEIAEAVEADRHDRRAKLDMYYQEVAVGAIEESQIFEATIKDSVEDELADAFIRLLDYFYYKEGKAFQLNVVNVEFDGTFAESMFSIAKMLGRYQLKSAASSIIVFCKENDIDLEEHVKLKMRYNDQRSRMHGGKKY